MNKDLETVAKNLLIRAWGKQAWLTGAQMEIDDEPMYYAGRMADSIRRRERTQIKTRLDISSTERIDYDQGIPDIDEAILIEFSKLALGKEGELIGNDEMALAERMMIYWGERLKKLEGKS